MKTYQPTSAPLDQTTDVAYRAWVTEFINALTSGAWSLGGVQFSAFQQTADTGQLTSAALSTAVRPAINTATGYVVMKFTDTQAPLCNIFIKIEFGSGNPNTNPSIWFTVGTQTDGAGTIGGTILLGRTQYTAAPLATGTNRPTYSTCGDGYFAMVFKQGGWSASGNSLLLYFCRGFDDTTGVATSDGIQMCISVANSQPIPINITSNNETIPGVLGVTNAAMQCLIPGAITSSLVDGIPQAFKHAGAFPKVQTLKAICSCVNTEIATGLTFQANLCGDGAHTYVSLPLGGNQNPNYNNVAGYNIALIWENDTNG